MNVFLDVFITFDLMHLVSKSDLNIDCAPLMICIDKTEDNKNFTAPNVRLLLLVRSNKYLY